MCIVTVMHVIVHGNFNVGYIIVYGNFNVCQCAR